MKRLPLSSLVVLLAFSAPAAASDWTLEHDAAPAKSQLRLWSRPMPGSSYPEYRMELRLRAAPDEVLGALESNMLDERTWPASFRRELLHREPGLVITYDYISVPLLSDRDAVIRTEWRRDPASGAVRMEWSATRETGPPPRMGVVRMPRSEGFWNVEPDGQGGSRAVYQSFVEFSGSIPGSLVSAHLVSSILEQATWLEQTLRERKLARRP